jgi:hypothetical protein
VRGETVVANFDVLLALSVSKRERERERYFFHYKPTVRQRVMAFPSSARREGAQDCP